MRKKRVTVKKTRGRKNQQLLLDQSFKIKKIFGGSLLKKSHAKIARPISTKEAMHIVLRSSLAKGKYSMLEKNRARRIKETIEAQAKRFQIQIYEFANVGNHIHLLVKAYHRDLFKGFLRAIAGLIARIALGVERGKAKALKFWDQRPFTRIVSWKKDFERVKDYVVQNFDEALGFTPFKPRKHRSTA